MNAYYQGKLSPENMVSFPESFCEHIIATSYGWGLPEIRVLPPKKFQYHMMMCLMRQQHLHAVQARSGL